MDKVTAPRLAAFKAEGRPIVCVTAYDVPTARAAEEAGVDLVLVGDSLGNVLLGHANTLPVSLEDMVVHTRAVASVCRRPLLVTDLPFGSYQASVEESVRSAVAVAKAGAEAVKLEGDYPRQIDAIVRAGIPVVSHLGMTPQSVHRFGGFRVQGRGEQAEQVVAAACRLQDAGACALVLELVPAELAGEITDRLTIPTIGIGAGPACDGQIQVWHDVLGFTPETFRHVRRYAELGAAAVGALRAYAEDVRAKRFPTKENSF
ncbi:MAG: 3-methyl-2-oxobutanoate hydroxymethyltransferase [Fimbriimonadales bacterium]|nr:3-methyl-2-oxobutanoate hydroxymethyltransferase [Fimbriimonadales bacterium]